jgi:general stress protein 26
MKRDIFTPHEADQVRKIAHLLQGLKTSVAMMTTLDESGRMHSRPMLLQKDRFDGNLWFFSDDSSQKIAELRWNRQVLFTCFDAQHPNFITIAGTAQVTRDKVRAKALWTAEHPAWFPKGPEDPDLILIKVEVDRVESWKPAYQKIELAG